MVHARLSAWVLLSEADPSVIPTASPVFSHYLYGGAKNNRCHLANKAWQLYCHLQGDDTQGDHQDY